VNPFPFVVGCERSGTTLLRAMLDSHPEMAVPPESYFVAAMARRQRRYQTRTGFDCDLFMGELFDHRWFRAWGLPERDVRAAMGSAPPANLADAVRRVYELYAARETKRRYGDKTPGYVFNLPLLAGVFAEARFVHVIRDGRNVALSLQAARFGPERIDRAATAWKRAVSRGQIAGRKLGATRYMEVRYEDLVEEPESSLRRVCTFIELPFDAAMLRYFDRADELTASFKHPEQHRHLSLPPVVGLRDWRTEMSQQDVLTFEVIAGDLRSRLGYAPAPVRVTPRSAIRVRALELAAEGASLSKRIHKRVWAER